MKISQIIKELSDAGITGDALVMAIKRIEDAQDTRSAGAKRQANYRERKHNESVTSVTKTPPLVPPLNGFPDPSLNPPYNPPQKVLMPRATRLPKDHVLPEEWIEHSMKAYGWNRDMCKDVHAAFVDWWIAKAGKDGGKLDWYATWRTWCRNQKSFANPAKQEPTRRNVETL